MTILEEFEHPILFMISYNFDGRYIVEVATRENYVGLYKDDGNYLLAHRIEVKDSEVPIASYEYKGKILRIHRAKSKTNVYVTESGSEGWVFHEMSFDVPPKSINGAFFDGEHLVTVSVVDADFDPRSRLNIYKIKGVQRFEHAGKTSYSDEFTSVDIEGDTLVAGTRKGTFLLYRLKGKMLKSDVEVELVAKERFKGSIEAVSIISPREFILGTSRGEVILATHKKEIESVSLSIGDPWAENRTVKGKVTAMVKLSDLQRKYTKLDLIASTAEIHHYDGKAEATGGVIEVSVKGKDPFQMNFLGKPLKLIHPYMKDLIYVQIDSQNLELKEDFFE